MGPPPLHWLDTNWWCSNHSIVVLLLHVLSSSFPMQFLPLPLDVVSFYSFLKLIPFTRVCLSRKQCGFVLSSPFGPVDLSRYFLYYFLLTPVGPTHLAFFFFALPFLMEPVKAYFLLSWRGSSHRDWPFPTSHGPLYSIPYFFMGIPFLWALGTWSYCSCHYSLVFSFFLLA